MIARPVHAERHFQKQRRPRGVTLFPTDVQAPAQLPQDLGCPKAASALPGGAFTPRKPSAEDLPSGRLATPRPGAFRPTVRAFALRIRFRPAADRPAGQAGGRLTYRTETYSPIPSALGETAAAEAASASEKNHVLCLAPSATVRTSRAMPEDARPEHPMRFPHPDRSRRTFSPSGGRIASATPRRPRDVHGLTSCSPETQSRQGTVPASFCPER
jgi:hypothetical protein